MKKFIIEETEYELTKNHKDAFDETLLKEKYTPDFNDYDYIVGDFAYNKLRLKGFYDSNNKKVKPYNNIKNLDDYINNNCAYECKYFVIKKI